MENLKVIGKALAAAVVFLLFFRYAARFSPDQSFALAALAWLVYMKFWVSEPAYFDPHRISIMPNWYELLIDHHLIKDLDEWKRIQDGLDQAPASDYNLLRDGITFTVLKPADLIYRDDHKKFSRYVDFEENIPGVTFIRGSVECFPSVAVRSFGGYELRITAPDSLKGVEPDERGLFNIAFLPREAFCFYWEDKGKFNARRSKRLQATQIR
jgi:hypothetical protein